MLIKNTNPNELLAEFKRDKNFCPYNEKEFERLKKEAELLRKDITSDITISHNGTWFRYNLLEITDDKGVCYEYEKHGGIYTISEYSKEKTEYIRFEDWNKIVFFYSIKNSDGNSVWSVEATRTCDLNREIWLRIGEEVKFRVFGCEIMGKE